MNPLEKITAVFILTTVCCLITANVVKYFDKKYWLFKVTEAYNAGMKDVPKSCPTGCTVEQAVMWWTNESSVESKRRFCGK